jgi:ATPase family AAA domain-containing protein 3A/B
MQGEPERLALLKLYFSRYIGGVGGRSAATGADADVLQPRRMLGFMRGEQSLPSIEVASDVTDDLFKVAAAKTEGFSGRELAKLMGAVQAAVYGSPPPRLLSAAAFQQVVAYKVSEHAHKRSILDAGSRKH